MAAPIVAEQWAQEPVRPQTISPPPRPLEVQGASVVVQPDRVNQGNPSANASSGNLTSILGCRDVPSKPTALATERVVSVRMADVTPEPVRWLWPGRFALGNLSLIAGEPGLGKSVVTLDIAARVSRGTGWPCDEASQTEPGGVVLLSAEDDLKDTIRPRLDAAGADCGRIEAMRAIYRPDHRRGIEVAVAFTLVEHIHHVEALIGKVVACKLVIVDPVSAFLGGTDSHNNSEVRAVLAPLAEMAARNRVPVVAVTHLNKGQGSALNRVIGSIAFTAAAQATYVVTRDADDAARRLMLPAKNNLGCDENGFAYRLEGDPTPRVEWEPKPVSMSADEAVGRERRTRGPLPEARHDAEAWLLDFPADVRTFRRFRGWKETKRARAGRQARTSSPHAGRRRARKPLQHWPKNARSARGHTRAEKRETVSSAEKWWRESDRVRNRPLSSAAENGVSFRG